MKQQAKGQIHERITAIPNAWYPAYIIQGEKKNLMIDAGVNLLGPRYLIFYQGHPWRCGATPLSLFNAFAL